MANTAFQVEKGFPYLGIIDKATSIDHKWGLWVYVRPGGMLQANPMFFDTVPVQKHKAMSSADRDSMYLCLYSTRHFFAETEGSNINCKLVVEAATGGGLNKYALELGPFDPLDEKDKYASDEFNMLLEFYEDWITQEQRSLLGRGERNKNDDRPSTASLLKDSKLNSDLTRKLTFKIHQAKKIRAKIREEKKELMECASALRSKGDVCYYTESELDESQEHQMDKINERCRKAISANSRSEKDFHELCRFLMKRNDSNKKITSFFTAVKK